MERTGVKIVVPPHSVDQDEIVVSGEKEGVLEAKRFILAVFEEKVPEAALTYALVLLHYILCLFAINFFIYIFLSDLDYFLVICINF